MSLRSNSVTRQVSFNRTKIGGKCQNSNTTFWVIFKQCVWDKTMKYDAKPWNNVANYGTKFFFYEYSHVQQHKAVLIWSYVVALHTLQIQCDVISVSCVSCCHPDWFHIVAWLKPPHDIWIKMEISEFGYETADSLRLYRCKTESHPRCILYANVYKWQNYYVILMIKICHFYVVIWNSFKILCQNENWNFWSRKMSEKTKKKNFGILVKQKC